MNARKCEESRIANEIDGWQRRHGVTLTHEAKRQLLEIVGNRVDAEKAKSLSLSQESFNLTLRNQG